MPGDYGVLAPIYDRLGFSDFARSVTPSLLNYAQQNGWLGRRILDLGCGTGASLRWFAEHGYMVAGVDNAPEMILVARAALEQTGINSMWVEQDIRALTGVIDPVHLVISLGVMNELEGLRDLEVTFNNIHKVLADEKMLIFDLYTIEGLSQRSADENSITYDSEDLTVICDNSYDFDRQIHTRHYTIFQRTDTNWIRADALRVLRAYPVQAIAGLLKRCNFDVKAVLNQSLQRYEPNKMGTHRVIFVAEKR